MPLQARAKTPGMKNSKSSSILGSTRKDEMEKRDLMFSPKPHVAFAEPSRSESRSQSKN